MAISREERIKWGRQHAMDPDFTEELDRLDAERAFETDAETMEEEDSEEGDFSTDGEKRKEHGMATRVSFAIPRREIEQTGITFTRTTDDGLHGELTVRKNHLVWRSKNDQYTYEVGWGEFEVFAVNNGKKKRQKTTTVKGSKKLKGPAA